MYELFDHAMELLRIKEGEVMDDERFQEIIKLSVQIPLKEPQRWKLYMSLAFQRDVTEMLMTEMMARMEPYLVSVSSYFQQKGYRDPMVMVRIFSAVLDGIQMHCLLDPDHFPAEAAEQFLIDQFVTS
jgi:hypothetical protein